MNKRGLSAIISVAISILIVIVIIILISSYLKKIPLKDTQSKLNCVQDVEIQILSACYENNILKIKLKNKNDIILGDFFLITYFYNDGTSKIVPSSYLTSLQPYETKTILMPYHENLIKIKVIPRIESQSYLCPEQAPEFQPILQCENE